MRSRTRRENAAFGGVFIILLIFIGIAYAASHGRPDLAWKDDSDHVPELQGATTVSAAAPAAGVAPAIAPVHYPSAAGLYQASCRIPGGAVINGRIAVDVAADPRKITSINLKDDATGQVYTVRLSGAQCQFAPIRD